MSTRSTIAAALASLGVLGLGWNAATDDGGTLFSSEQATSTTNSPGTAPADNPGSTARSTGGSAGTSAGETPGGSASAGTAAGGSAAPSSSGQWTDGTYTGTTERHHYGSVTVTVTIADGRIEGLSEKVSSDGDHHSDRINARAIPTLKSRIVAADSAQVSTISGATYTTEAYLSSLQAALDQASS